MIDSQVSLGLLGILCHNSSVTKGMNGCNNFKPKSMQVNRVSWLPLRDSGVPSLMRGLMASYSRKFFKKKFPRKKKEEEERREKDAVRTK